MIHRYDLLLLQCFLTNAQNPLYMFPRNLTGKLPTCWQKVVVMEFGKWHDTTDFCPHQLVTDLLWTCRLCCGFVMGKSPTCYGLATGETGVLDFGLKRAYKGNQLY